MYEQLFVSPVQVSVGKTAKIVEITGIITNGIQNLCNCYDINIDYYEAVSLVCDEGGDKSTVIYYGSVSTNQALEYVKTWVKNTDKVYIFGTKLAINTDCPVRIEEIDNTKCASPSSQRHSGSNTAAVAAPVVIILTLVVVVVLVLVAGFLYIRRKHGKSYNFFRYIINLAANIYYSSTLLHVVEDSACKAGIYLKAGIICSD